MANPIVTVLVSQQQAPTPNTLQKTGAIISQDATTLTAGSSTLIQQPSDLTPHLKQPASLVSVLFQSTYNGQVLATTTVAHGIPLGTRFQTTIKGYLPDAYNGNHWAVAQSATTFTYPLPGYGTAGPGGAAGSGTYTSAAVGELNSAISTFFAQGYQQGVYVLELGPGSVQSGVAALDTHINNNDQIFYSYLVPRNWDATTDFLNFVSKFQHDTAKTYFFVTTTLSTYTAYTDQMKCVVALIEAPRYGSWARNVITATSWSAAKLTLTTTSVHGVRPGDWVTLTGFLPATLNGNYMAQPNTASSTLVINLATSVTVTQLGALAASVHASEGVMGTEMTMAAAWWVTLSYSPGATSRVPPYSYSFLNGVTRFPTQGNQAAMTILKAANINLVGYGGEGGISDNILLYGHTMDGRPFNYWYSVDWMQVNIDLNIANAIINGSNTTVNPLYYNQDGINRLAGVAAGTGAQGISFGLALGRVIQVGLPHDTFHNNLNRGIYAGSLVVNADPFTSYLTNNPAHYKDGLYGGLTMVYAPLRGFEHIIFSILVTDFVASST